MTPLNMAALLSFLKSGNHADTSELFSFPSEQSLAILPCALLLSVLLPAPALQPLLPSSVYSAGKNTGADHSDV